MNLDDVARFAERDHEAVVIAAHDRWGMGLAQKRDEELGDVAGLDFDTVRTKRGRITLRLGKGALRLDPKARDKLQHGRKLRLRYRIVAVETGGTAYRARVTSRAKR